MDWAFDSIERAKLVATFLSAAGPPQFFAPSSGSIPVRLDIIPMASRSSAPIPSVSITESKPSSPGRSTMSSGSVFKMASSSFAESIGFGR